MNNNRLHDDTEYVRPKTTITELVQNRKDILEILEGHDEVKGDELDELPHNTKVKYITYCDTVTKYDRLMEEHEELKNQSELIFDKHDRIITSQNAEIARLRKMLQSNNISYK